MGYSWPGVFLLGASRRPGRFFTQPLFHDLMSVSLWFRSLELSVTWIVFFCLVLLIYYFSMIRYISCSLFGLQTERLA